MQRIKLLFILWVLLSFLNSFGQTNEIKITAVNPLSIERDNETLSLDWNKLKSRIQNLNSGNTAVYYNGREIISQKMDYDSDSKIDELIFQSDFKLNETKEFIVKKSEEKLSEVQSLVDAQFELPPEDFALEFDKSYSTSFGGDKTQWLIKGKTQTGKKIIYYAGFGWTRSGDFNSFDDWNNYMKEFSLKIQSPIEIKF